MRDDRPFPGLEPFDEADSQFFFGRDADIRLVAASAVASPIAVVCGPSGVGKTSLLRAGVLPRLRQSTPTVVYFDEWFSSGMLGHLCETIATALDERTGSPQDSRDLPFDALLRRCNELTDGPVCLVFDQFEQYVLVEASSDDRDEFERQLARAVNSRDIDAHVILSIREDWLARLDRFRLRIPGILNQMIRITPLTREAAREAILRPVAVFNQARDRSVVLEDGFAETIVDELSSGAVNVEGLDNRQAYVNPGLLQIVLSQLWDYAMARRYSLLTRALLQETGGAQKLLRSYVPSTLATLSAKEQDLWSRVVPYLITPSGLRIAHTAGDLADYALVEAGAIERLLQQLAASRILRLVSRDRVIRYEVAHDVLAAPLLDWRRNYQRSIT